MRGLKLLVLVLLAFAGCDAGTKYLLIEGPNGGEVRISDLNAGTGQADGMAFRVNESTLLINNVPYGRVEIGQKVKVEKDGAVRVNGERREPATPSQ